jgi:hypothetical protein
MKNRLILYGVDVILVTSSSGSSSIKHTAGIKENGRK